MNKQRTIQPVFRKTKRQEQGTDFKYWQSRTPEERLATLELIRREYNQWKYGSEPRFQKVLLIIKRQ
jgi:hypothetical protein